MWWKVLCKKCKAEDIIRVNPDYNIQFTCTRYECTEKLIMVEEVPTETVTREFKKPYDHGKMNNTVN